MEVNDAKLDIENKLPNTWKLLELGRGFRNGRLGGRCVESLGGCGGRHGCESQFQRFLAVGPLSMLPTFPEPQFPHLYNEHSRLHRDHCA